MKQKTSVPSFCLTTETKVYKKSEKRRNISLRYQYIHTRGTQVQTKWAMSHGATKNPKENQEPTCIATGKSSAKSGGKNRSACFFVKGTLPAPTECALVVKRRFSADIKDSQRRLQEPRKHAQLAKTSRPQILCEFLHQSTTVPVQGQENGSAHAGKLMLRIMLRNFRRHTVCTAHLAALRAR